MTRNEQVSHGFYQFRRGLSDIAVGSYYIGKNMARELWRAFSCGAHRFPFVYMAIEAIIFVAIFFVTMGKARAERDHATHTAYAYQTSRDSLQVLIDLKSARQWK